MQNVLTGGPHIVKAYVKSLKMANKKNNKILEKIKGHALIVE